MTPDQKRDRFRAIVGRRAAISLDWQRGGTPSGDGILARAIMEKHPEPILTFDAWADRGDIDFIVHAPDDIAFLIALVRELGARNRPVGETEHAPPETKPYSPAQNCGKWCNDRMFQRFMHEVHGLDHPHDPQRMATRIRSMLAIASRADLDIDEAAAARWHSLRAEFKSWRQGKL